MTPERLEVSVPMLFSASYNSETLLKMSYNFYNPQSSTKNKIVEKLIAKMKK